MVAIGSCLTLVIGGVLFKDKLNNFSGSVSTDEALLSLIKNDQNGFENFIKKGGDVHANLPVIDGKTYTVSEGMAHFERPGFVKFLQGTKRSFINQDGKKEFDILSLAVEKNNVELFTLLINEKPRYDLTYTQKNWTLLHMASASCSHKIVTMLHKEAGLNWNTKAKDGSTPLTLAAEYDCLPVLGYWKELKADFNAKDGRGLTALSILRKKKDAAFVAFVDSFNSRKIASIGAPAGEPNFYNKRKIPKDQMIDHSALIEPEDRPLEATETAENSEFAD